MLREQREALGYQIDRIAELMKVRIDFIERLESQEQETAYTTHEILCIRRYCEILGVDFNKLEINRANNPIKAAVKANPQSSNKIRYILLVVAIIFILFETSARHSKSPEIISEIKEEISDDT